MQLWGNILSQDAMLTVSSSLQHNAKYHNVTTFRVSIDCKYSDYQQTDLCGGDLQIQMGHVPFNSKVDIIV